MGSTKDYQPSAATGIFTTRALEEASSPPKIMLTNTTSSSETSLVNNRPKTTFFHGGIGGVGNYRRIISENKLELTSNLRTSEPMVSPHARQARRSHLPRSLKHRFSSGIGGVGNMHTRAEEAALSPEEQMVQARIRQSHLPRRYFVGIGGMGNRRGPQRQDSDFASSTTSTSGQSHLGAAEALKRKLLGLGDRSRS